MTKVDHELNCFNSVLNIKKFKKKQYTNLLHNVINYKILISQNSTNFFLNLNLNQIQFYNKS